MPECHNFDTIAQATRDWIPCLDISSSLIFDCCPLQSLQSGHGKNRCHNCAPSVTYWLLRTMWPFWHCFLVMCWFWPVASIAECHHASGSIVAKCACMSLWQQQAWGPCSCIICTKILAKESLASRVIAEMMRALRLSTVSAAVLGCVLFEDESLVQNCFPKECPWWNGILLFLTQNRCFRTLFLTKNSCFQDNFFAKNTCSLHGPK